MTREELDTLWFQAMRQSIEEGEDFIRYHFAALVAALVAAHEREACAKVCEDDVRAWSIPGSITKAECAAAIRKRGEVKP